MLPLLALVHAWLVPPRAGLVQPRFSHAPRRADLAAMCDMMPAINFMSDEEIGGAGAHRPLVDKRPAQQLARFKSASPGGVGGRSV